MNDIQAAKPATKYYLKINHRSILNSFLNCFQYNIKEYDFPISSVHNHKSKILFKSQATNFLSIKAFYAGSRSFVI